MAELGVYLAEKGISKEMLNIPINRESRNQVALRIGKNWESLATCIGIPSQEVFDLKETYPTSPQDQRLGMMNRWEELYGSMATYLKLIEGLEQTGRRDLTEFLVGIFNGSPFNKVKDEEFRQKAASELNKDRSVPSHTTTHNSSSNKPGYLPLRDPNSGSLMLSHNDQLGLMGVCGPQSEPVKKQVNSPGRLFWSSPPCNFKGQENAVVRRAAITPETISAAAMGQNDLKMFRNHYSGTQLTLSPSTYGNPFSTTNSTVSLSRSNCISQPNQPSNSDNTDAWVDRFANFNICDLPWSHSETNAKKSKELARRGRLSLPSTKSDASNLGGGTSMPSDLNDTGVIAHTKSEPQYIKEHSSSQGGRGRESVKSSLPQELSCLDQLPDMNSSLPDSGIEFATIAPTPSEPTVPLPNPHTPLSQDEESKSGITESQDAVGSDYLSCGHLRCPSLKSTSSIDSNSPLSSLETNPVQVSEKSPGEYHPLAQSKRPFRQRCRKCAKLKQESNMLKEKLDKVQSEWNTEREQNTKQIRELKEELHRQRLDTYELKQCVYGSEVRHRKATKTIQKLQMELQNMTQLFKLQQTEHARLKEAYDCCLIAKCELFKVQLQRADSMQCPEEMYRENAADNSHYEQYSMNNGPNHYTDGYHEQTMTAEWQTANFQAMHMHTNTYVRPHAI